jgi:hypothetical protein
MRPWPESIDISREDEVTALYEGESVPALTVIMHPTVMFFLDWADYICLMEQLLGERREFEAEGVVVVKEKAPTSDELHELKLWLEGGGMG